MVRFNVGPLTYLLASFVHDIKRALSPSKDAKAAITLRQLVASRRPERQQIYALPANASAHAALLLMLKEHISVVAVLDPLTKAPLGVLTQGDFLRRVAAPEKSAHATALRAVMTPIEQTAYCFPDQSVDDGLETLAVVGAHHIPVMTDEPPAGILLGILSQDELLGLTRDVRDARARQAGARVRYYNAATGAVEEGLSSVGTAATTVFAPGQSSLVGSQRTAAAGAAAAAPAQLQPPVIVIPTIVSQASPSATGAAGGRQLR